jgi:two-component system response regulator FixJ
VKGAGPLVYLVDDDDAVRDSLGLLLRSIGLDCALYASALDFLEHYDPSRHACLVADIRMPGLSGLELQQRLNEQRAEIPIIFITGHGDVPMAVNAMKAGAADFIQKPFRDQDLIDRIHKALDRDRERRASRAEEDTIRARLALLTPRETEVMERVVRGQANKVIAMDLGVSQRTVELHRARVMRKLKMRSLAELVHAVDKISVPSAPGTESP